MREAQAATKATQQAVQTMGTSVTAATKTAGQAFASMGAEMAKVAAGAAVAFGAIGQKAVGVLLPFDQQITEAVAKLGVFGKEADTARIKFTAAAKALALSGQVAFDPAQLARGLEELVGAGLDAEQAISALPRAAKLAQAGAMDIGVAAKLASAAISSFGQRSKDIDVFTANFERFSDIAVKVGQATETTTEGILRAFSADSAAAAKTYGISLTQLGAILAAYAKSNKHAEEAGNLAGRMMRLLTAEAVENKAAWKSLGIEVFHTAGVMKGKIRDFPDIIEQMEKQFEGRGPEDIIKALSAMGIETLAQKSIIPLIGMSKFLRETEAQIKETGITSKTAAGQMESLANQLKVITNAVDVAAIEFGSSLIPVLKEIGETVKGVSEWFISLDKSTKDTIATVATYTVAVGGAVIVFKALSFAFGGLIITTVGVAVSLVKLTAATIAYAFSAKSATVASGAMNMSLLATASASTAATAATTTAATGTAAMTGVLTAAGAAAVAMKFGLHVVTAYLAGEFLFAVLGGTKALMGFHAEMVRWKVLLPQTLGALDKGFTKTLGDLDKVTDPAAKVEAVTAALDRAEKELAGVNLNLEKAKKTFAEATTLDKNIVSGIPIIGRGFTADAKAAQAEVDAATKKAKAYADQVGKLRDELEKLPKVKKVEIDVNIKGPFKEEKDLNQFLDQMFPGRTPPVVKLPPDVKVGIDKLEEALKKQGATLGMTGAQADIYAFKLLGAAEANLANVKALDQMNKARDTFLEATKSVKEFEKALKDEIAVIGMSADAAKLWKATRDAIAAGVNIDAKKMAELTALTEVKRAGDLIQEFKAPETKFAEKIAELNKLFKAGKIDVGTYDRAVAAARKEMGGLVQEVTKFDVALIGSAEAITRMEKHFDMLAGIEGPGPARGFGAIAGAAGGIAGKAAADAKKAAEVAVAEVKTALADVELPLKFTADVSTVRDLLASVAFLDLQVGVNLAGLRDVLAAVGPIDVMVNLTVANLATLNQQIQNAASVDLTFMNAADVLASLHTSLTDAANVRLLFTYDLAPLVRDLNEIRKVGLATPGMTEAMTALKEIKTAVDTLAVLQFEMMVDTSAVDAALAGIPRELPLKFIPDMTAVHAALAGAGAVVVAAPPAGGGGGGPVAVMPAAGAPAPPTDMADILEVLRLQLAELRTLTGNPTVEITVTDLGE